jgi:hypothetical protein
MKEEKSAQIKKNLFFSTTAIILFFIVNSLINSIILKSLLYFSPITLTSSSFLLDTTPTQLSFSMICGGIISGITIGYFVTRRPWLLAIFPSLIFVNWRLILHILTSQKNSNLNFSVVLPLFISLIIASWLGVLLGKSLRKFRKK